MAVQQDILQKREPRLRVFESRILRRVIKHKMDGIGEWRRLHNEQFYTMYRSPDIVKVIKSRKLTWAGHVARKEKKVGILSRF